MKCNQSYDQVRYINMKTDNKTLFAIQDDTERSIFVLWSLTVFLASLAGDSIILIATIRYKAIKLHKVIIAVMQHMAICDLMLAVFKVFPGFLALIIDRWVLGEMLCHVQYNISWMCGPMTVFLTSAMAILKLIMVQYPLKTGAWSTRLGHRICSVVWLLMLGWYTPVLVVSVFYIRDTLRFSYIDYGCNYDLYSPTVPIWYTLYFPISVAVLSIVPCMILIISSILLLIVASRAGSRHGQSLRLEGVITVLLTVVVFLLSYLPITVVAVAAVAGVQPSSTTRNVLFHVSNINTMANFFIYSLSVRSFRHFLREKISELLPSKRSSNQRRLRPIQRPKPLQRIPPRQGSSEMQIDGITSVIKLPILQLEEDKRNSHRNIQDESV